MIDDKYKKMVEMRIKSSFEEWAGEPSVAEREIYRFLHNLKGTAGTVGMAHLEAEAERLLQAVAENGKRIFSYKEWFGLLKPLLAGLPGGHGAANEAGETDLSLPMNDSVGKRILIIDDDVDLAAFLKGILEEKGYPVHIALTAERGLKLFYDWKPDMILLDILLPDSNGLEVLKLIVDKSHQEHTPIIVISTSDTREQRIHAYRYGAMDFFAKPIDQELLLALIDNRFRMKLQWQQSIIVDELTGAYNRKHFNWTMMRLISDFQRSGGMFSLILLDLDHFKRVNDTYGHLVGDEVLKGFASAVMGLKREVDILCRYGGEEFALIVPHVRRDEAAELLEPIRESFSSQWFAAGDQRFQVTFTAGITDINGCNSHPEKMVEEADQALYFGKQSGRNQTALYSSQMGSGEVEQRKLGIIIIDDDPLIREIVISKLTLWNPLPGLQVTVRGYEDGGRFLESDWYSDRSKYIVLLDGAMPNMDGVEVLEKLRESYPERDISIAMLTARTNQTDIIYALQQGADDYIIKPFLVSELLSRVERLMHKLYK
ncbi:response regulator [Paenibacillus sp. GCM10027627]|uniref:response regulator n=1 Tax=unclassified Paenibacillus TaxID=185978 RepID=UPI0036347785